MRFIHTADWHLGKTLKGISLLDDQNFLLNGELLKLADDWQPDAIIIAGDIYDRAVPPTDAVNLFDEIIFKLTEKKIPVLCIAGNHDSADRLNFGTKLMAQAKFFLAAKPEKIPTTIILEDKFGEVFFSLIPFFNSAELRETFGAENFPEKFDLSAANNFYIAEARKKIPANKRSVAVAHLFALGGMLSDSERKFVGGVESVDTENFSAYNYTALGHLHKPQNMKKTNFVVRYSGSPLKYSFDEATHEKGVTLVELGGDGEIFFEQENLTPKRDVKIFSGTMEELLNSARTEDYIFAQLEDKNYLLNAMDKLREKVFPNILGLDFVNLEGGGEISSQAEKFSEDRSVLEQFADFFEDKTGETFGEEYRGAMEKFLSELETEMRN